MLKKRSVLFAITEDWFFVSHFLPMARRVVEQGFVCSVVCRVTDPALRAAIEGCGIRVIGTGPLRQASGPIGQIRQIARLRRLFARERPDIVHLISLRMVVNGGLASLLARVPLRILALTGLGLLGAARTRKARLGLDGIGWLLRHILGGPRTVFLFENHDDPARLGLLGQGSRVLVVGGAGVDPMREAAQPLPSGATLRIAVVSRMIRSKGVDVAVEAVALARRQGCDVALTLVGEPDRDNPQSLTDRDLERMAALPGVTWVGRSRDIAAVWRDHHVVCVPSLGGEGLPRSLLEGAAAGRAVVATATPGCSSFVRPGLDGLLVPPGDAAALGQAFMTLAGDRELVRRMGLAARTRVLDGYTIEHVAEAVLRIYGPSLPVGAGAQVDLDHARAGARGG